MVGVGRLAYEMSSYERFTLESLRQIAQYSDHNNSLSLSNSTQRLKSLVSLIFANHYSDHGLLTMLTHPFFQASVHSAEGAGIRRKSKHTQSMGSSLGLVPINTSGLQR